MGLVNVEHLTDGFYKQKASYWSAMPSLFFYMEYNLYVFYSAMTFYGPSCHRKPYIGLLTLKTIFTGPV